jgi:hypothetical protein
MAVGRTLDAGGSDAGVMDKTSSLAAARAGGFGGARTRHRTGPTDGDEVTEALGATGASGRLALDTDGVRSTPSSPRESAVSPQELGRRKREGASFSRTPSFVARRQVGLQAVQANRERGTRSEGVVDKLSQLLGGVAAVVQAGRVRRAMPGDSGLSLSAAAESKAGAPSASGMLAGAGGPRPPAILTTMASSSGLGGAPKPVVADIQWQHVEEDGGDETDSTDSDDGAYRDDERIGGAPPPGSSIAPTGLFGRRAAAADSVAALVKAAADDSEEEDAGVKATVRAFGFADDDEDDDEDAGAFGGGAGASGATTSRSASGRAAPVPTHAEALALRRAQLLNMISKDRTSALARHAYKQMAGRAMPSLRKNTMNFLASAGAAMMAGPSTAVQASTLRTLGSTASMEALSPTMAAHMAAGSLAAGGGAAPTPTSALADAVARMRAARAAGGTTGSGAAARLGTLGGAGRLGVNLGQMMLDAQRDASSGESGGDDDDDL